jgi:ABC-type Mn2+/Zn2+ transport system ATPase subunit
MQGQDEPDVGAPDEPNAAAPPEAESAQPASAVITATGLGVDGEHGPLFSDVDLKITPGFHAIQMPGGPGQDTLLLTLAGRLKPSRGTVTVLGDTQPRGIRRHCSIAAFADIDELEESVTVETVVAEQRRWLAPWYSSVPITAGQTELAEVFGEIPPPSGKAYIVELSDLELFLLRITLALFSDRPILVIGDLEQVRDDSRRKIAVDRLGEIATRRTVVVGVTNPLGSNAPDHDLHDHRDSIGRD